MGYLSSVEARSHLSLPHTPPDIVSFGCPPSASAPAHASSRYDAVRGLPPKDLSWPHPKPPISPPMSSHDRPLPPPAQPFSPARPSSSSSGMMASASGSVTTAAAVTTISAITGIPAREERPSPVAAADRRLDGSPREMREMREMRETRDARASVGERDRPSPPRPEEPWRQSAPVREQLPSLSSLFGAESIRLPPGPAPPQRSVPPALQPALYARPGAERLGRSTPPQWYGAERDRHSPRIDETRPPSHLHHHPPSPRSREYEQPPSSPWADARSGYAAATGTAPAAATSGAGPWTPHAEAKAERAGYAHPAPTSAPATTPSMAAAAEHSRGPPPPPAPSYAAESDYHHHHHHAQGHVEPPYHAPYAAPHHGQPHGQPSASASASSVPPPPPSASRSPVRGPSATGGSGSSSSSGGMPLTPASAAYGESSVGGVGMPPKEGMGPKIWTGVDFLPQFLRATEVPGEGMCYFYDDGSHCKAVIDGEAVNPYWGVTKAGKPRKRLAIACMTCREKKIKCDPEFPRCVQCEKFGRLCRFKNAPRGGNNTSPGTVSTEPDTLRKMGSVSLIRPPPEAPRAVGYADVGAARSSSPRTGMRRPLSPGPPLDLAHPHPHAHAPKRPRTDYDYYTTVPTPAATSMSGRGRSPPPPPPPPPPPYGSTSSSSSSTNSGHRLMPASSVDVSRSSGVLPPLSWNSQPPRHYAHPHAHANTHPHPPASSLPPPPPPPPTASTSYAHPSHAQPQHAPPQMPSYQRSYYQD